MKYFLIGVVVGFAICLVGAYFITEPQENTATDIDPGYAWLERTEDGRWVKVTVISNNPVMYLHESIDTLPQLKQQP